MEFTSLAMFLADPPKGGGFQSNALLFLGIIVLLTVVIRFGMKRQALRASRDRAPSLASRRAVESQEDSVLRPEIQGLMVQLQELARDIEGSLDTRVRYAQRIINEADTASERLSSLLDKARTIDADQRIDASSVDVKHTEQADSPEEPAKLATGDQPKPTLGTHLDVSSRPTGDTTGDKQEIRRLAAEGAAPAEIAAKVGRPIGEVELVLALGRKAGSKP